MAGKLAASRGNRLGGELNDITIKQALAIPALLAIVTLVIAAAISSMTGVDGSRVFLPYLSAWAAVSVLAILSWIFVEVARLAPTGADRPLQRVIVRIAQPAQLIALPALIFPMFLGAYTWAKCSIPFAVGYGWERTCSDADRLIFGTDAWRLTHAVIPAAAGSAWTFFYAVVWGFALVFSGALVAVFASRRHVATFFTAMMMSWLIGGIGFAYAMSAGGPVFAHLVDPDLGARFSPLRQELVAMLGEKDMVLLSQKYLAAGMNVKIALKGGGISAMPSMHIATATILVMAASRSRWLPLAILFLLLTFVGSVHLGYHYAVDAPVAAVIAVLCWFAARRIYREPAAAQATTPGFEMEGQLAGQ